MYGKWLNSQRTAKTLKKTDYKVTESTKTMEFASKKRKLPQNDVTAKNSS
jgi:hypothetical protein